MCPCRRPRFPFPANVSYETLTRDVLLLKACSVFSLFPHIYVSPFLELSDAVFLGKAALSIMACLPSKRSLLPPYLCELIKISSSNCSLPLSLSFPSSPPSESFFPFSLLYLIHTHLNILYHCF